MRRELRFYLLGSLALVALAGCGRGVMQFAGERDAWRKDAELACLKSGTVKESPVIVRVEPIEGPGICGADFPLKVAALGDGPLLGYGDEIRPPGSISGGPERWPLAQQPRYAPPASAPRYVAPPDYAASTAGPMSIVPPAASTPQSYEPVATRPAYDSRENTGQPLRAPDAPRYAPVQAPQYAPAQEDDYDDVPDDAIVPNRAKAPPRQSYQPPYQPPKLGPMGAPNITGATKAAVTPTATLACPMVSALDQWVAEAVQPAALKWFRQPVVEIKQISAYSCRGMVGSGTGNISEHAFGNALDVAGFTLADGRKIVVKNGWNGTPEETGFLHDVQLAACERFNTVLAPGYNVYHYDHIHLDLMRRASGRKACKPYAMTGEEAAAKLSRSKYAQRNGGVTGAVGDRPVMKRRATAGDDGDYDEPTGSIRKKYKPQPAIAGEDGEFDD